METNNKKKSPVRLIIVSLVLIAGAFYGWKKITYAMHHESTDNAQVETLLVPVLPRVPGYVKQISVRDFDSVRAGDLVAQLDDAELQSQLLQINRLKWKLP